MITAQEAAEIADATIEARYRKMRDETIPDWAKSGYRVVTFKGLTQAHQTELIDAGYKMKESSITPGEWFIEW